MRRALRASVLAFCFACLAGCESSSLSGGGPPIAEWSVEPLPKAARGQGGGAHSEGLMRPRGGSGPAIVATGTGKLIGSSRGRAASSEPVGDDGVTLNLANLPIAQAAKIVIGDIRDPAHATHNRWGSAAGSGQCCDSHRDYCSAAACCNQRIRSRRRRVRHTPPAGRKRDR